MMSFQEATIPKPVEIDTSVLSFNQSQQSYSSLTDYDRQFYYWINYSRKNVHSFFDSVIAPVIKIYPQLKGQNSISLKENLQASPQLSLLALNHSLISMARAHSKDITSHNATPSHISTNGNSFIDRFKQNNLKKCGAENISFGSGDPVFLIALLFLDINIPDLGHRKTLLDPSLVETGIGSSSYKNGNIFLVEDFSCLQ